MIKALLLIFYTVPTWDRIVESRRNIGFILGVYLLPLLLLSSAGEVYGLMYWGKSRSEYGGLVQLSQNAAAYYAVIKITLCLASVFVIAKIIQSIAVSFRGRQTYVQAFTCTAYGISPLLALHLLNGLPNMPAWVTWAMGIALCATVLYQGMPRVLDPDPTHTLGLYFMSVLMLLMTTALVQFLTGLVLEQQIQAAITPHAALMR